jgi:hypothetical protein
MAEVETSREYELRSLGAAIRRLSAQCLSTFDHEAMPNLSVRAQKSILSLNANDYIWVFES